MRSRRAVSTQRARRMVGGRGGLAVRGREALALVLLMPLKRVDPFVVRVDNSTGIVDVVPVYAGARHAGGSGHPVFPHALSDRVRALQFRHCGKRLRGVRRLSFGAAQSGLVRAVDRHQSSVATQCAQGWQHVSAYRSIR